MPTTPSNREQTILLSRVANAYRMRLTAFGLRVGLMISDQLPPAMIASILPPWSKLDSEITEIDRWIRVELLNATSSPVAMEGFHWYDQGAYRRIATSFEDAILAGEQIIEHVVAEHARSHLFIHAGVVTWRDEAIIVPGKSHSGKSTLIRALVNAGACYFSDEFAPVDQNGMVIPYPRFLSQREGPFGPAGRIDLTDRAPATSQHIQSALVLLLRHEPGASLAVQQLTPGAAILAMSEHTFAFRSRPLESLSWMGRIASDVPVLTGTRGEADVTAQIILEALDGTAGMSREVRSERLGRWIASAH